MVVEFILLTCGIMSSSLTCSSLSTGRPSYPRPRPSHSLHTREALKLHYPRCTWPLQTCKRVKRQQRDFPAFQDKCSSSCVILRDLRSRPPSWLFSFSLEKMKNGGVCLIYLNYEEQVHINNTVVSRLKILVVIECSCFKCCVKSTKSFLFVHNFTRLQFYFRWRFSQLLLEQLFQSLHYPWALAEEGWKTLLSKLLNLKLEVSFFSAQQHSPCVLWLAVSDVFCPRTSGSSTAGDESLAVSLSLFFSPLLYQLIALHTSSLTFIIKGSIVTVWLSYFSSLFSVIVAIRICLQSFLSRVQIVGSEQNSKLNGRGGGWSWDKGCVFPDFCLKEKRTQFHIWSKLNFSGSNFSLPPFSRLHHWFLPFF